jgi:hypothetical protein
MTIVFQSAADIDFTRGRDNFTRIENEITYFDEVLNPEVKGDFIRRPMRGIVVPTDTHASLTVEGPSDRSRTLINSSTPPRFKTPTTHNFLLQNVTETRNEKSQFITTFGATYAFFFGEQPRLISCTALLPNTADFEWSKEWWANYSSTLRGTSLASSNSVAILKYGEGNDTTIIRGYITNCTSMVSAQDPYTVQISFSMFVESLTRGHVSYSAPRRTAGAGDYLGVGALDSADKELRLDESSTAAVRRLNIKLSPFKSEPGVLGKISAALNAVDAALDNTVRQARNFLYGRNMVIPMNYVASGPTREPIFAEGSGAESLEGLTLTNFFGAKILAFSNRPGAVKTVVLRTKTDGDLFGIGKLSKQRDTSRYYFQNSDEYVNAPVSLPTALARDIDTRVLIAGALTAGERALYAPQSVAAFAAFGIKVTPFPGPLDRNDRGALEKQANAYYWADYAAQKQAETLRIIGRIAFGVATFAIGDSVVNHRRRLQESITNPNSGNLSAAQENRLRGDIASAQQSSEQRRLVADRKAARLRGETGVIYPGTLGAVLSVIL